MQKEEQVKIFSRPKKRGGEHQKKKIKNRKKYFKNKIEKNKKK